MPGWATEGSRTLNFGWFIPEYQQARRWAMVYSPAAKLLASRATRDRDDLLLLIAHLGWNRRDDLIAAAARYFPHEELGTRQRSMLDSLGLQ